MDMFDLRFEKTFHLNEKGYNQSAVKFAQSAMSNMVGGIGYFYGSSVVKSKYNSLPVPYWEAPLYTGVPSRSFFPRGFLWDEGFHNLLISEWDLDISKVSSCPCIIVIDFHNLLISEWDLDISKVSS